MPRAFHRARFLVELAVDERAVVVRTAVLNRVDRSAAVENTDLEILPLDQAHGAWRELCKWAYIDGLRHVNLSPSRLIGFA